MISLFLLISFSASVIYLLICRAVLWKALLLFIGCFLAVNILYLLFFAAVGLFIDNSKPLKRPSRLCRWGCSGISSLGLGYCLVRSKAFGLEKLPDNGRFLLVCNHRSLFDPLILVRELKKYELSFIGKPDALSIPVVGRIGYGAGCLPINRENDREALKTVITAVDYLKKGFCSIAIFPEGTRNTTDDALLPFRSGSFKIAQRAGVPVAVACLKNTGSIRGNMFRRVTHTELHILEVLPAESVRVKKTHELAEYSSELIRKTYELR